jgi:2-dehydropantoate 2-reductase
MRVAILGTGGVGGYFGGRLAATGTDVTFIARGAHLEALRRNGLRLLSPEGDARVHPVRATDDPRHAGPIDVVLFTVKLYDMEAAVETLRALLGSTTLVVPFQNGVDAVEVLSRAVGAERVAGGTTYIVAAIQEPGVIRHTALGRLIFGPLHDSQSAALERLLEACRAARIDARLSDRIVSEIWAKFVRLTAFSGMTAVTRQPVGVLAADPDLWAMTLRAVDESMGVARARGVTLPGSLATDIPVAIRGMPPDSKSSMLTDLEAGRRLELPWLSGTVVRLGRTLGVPTPTHEFIATVLRPYVNGSPGIG